MRRTKRYLLTIYDEAKHTLTVTERPREGGKVPYELQVTRDWTERLLLEGNLSGEALSVRLHRVPPPRLLLRERGFHWVNETPFNR